MTAQPLTGAHEPRAGSRRHTLAFLLEHRAARSEVIADELVRTIERDHLAYRRAGVVPHEDLMRSCRTNVSAVLRLLAEAVSGDAPTSGDPAYAAARATGAQRSAQGLPLDDVLRSFRIGGRLIWEDLLEEGADHLDGTGLREVGSALWEVVDATSAAMATAYHERERSRVRGDEQRRASLWEGLLSGKARDPRFAREAASLLDVPAVGDLLVVLVSGDEPGAVERALAPHATALLQRGNAVLGLVALREERPDAAYVALRRLAAGPGRPRVASSAPVAGLHAVDEGHRQATLALEAGTCPGLVRYADVLPEALLLAVPEVTTALTDRWVAPLEALGEEGEGLLDTLEAWVAAGGSASRAAPHVPCHRNTVLNRLKRVAQVTAQPLDDGAPPLDLGLALRARSLRPPAS